VVKKLLVWVWLLLGVMVVGCGSRLPQKRPSDVQIGYSYDGGMMMYGEGISISEAGASQRIRNHLVEIEVQYQLSEAELDALYASFHDNKVDQITATIEEGLYDRGGDSVSISFGEEWYGARDNGASFIKSRWQDEFGRLVVAVNEATVESKNGETAVFDIQIDPSAQTSGLTVQLQMGDAFRGLISDLSTPELFQIRTDAGNGRFPISILDNQSEEIGTYMIDLTNSKGVLIQSSDGEIVLTPLQP